MLLDSDAGILHSHLQFVALDVVPNQHTYVSLGGKLERVGQIVSQDLLDTSFIGIDEFRNLFFYLNFELDSFVTCLEAEQFEDFVNRGLNVHPLDIYLKLVLTHQSKVKEVIDRAKEIFA